MTRKRKKQNARARRLQDKLRKRNERMQVVQAFQYRPVDNQWRNKQITRLSLPVQLFPVSEASDAALPLTDPDTCYRNTGDGNCFFNVISLILTGGERFARIIRHKVCDFMRHNVDMVKAFLPPEAEGSVDNHMQQKNMEENGAWATEAEIFSTACLLQTNIFLFTMYSQADGKWKWSRFSTDNTIYDQGIYIYHKDLNHFDLVVSVVNSDNIPGISMAKCYKKDKITSPCRSNPDNVLKHRLRAKMFHRQKYKTNTTFHYEDNKRRKMLHARKSLDPLFQKQRAEAEKRKYKSDTTYAHRKNSALRKKYRVDHFFALERKYKAYARYSSNSLVRARLKTLARLRSSIKYKTCKEFRKNALNYSIIRYKENKDVRDKKKDASKTKYCVNKTFKQNVKDSSRRKYHGNDAFRKKVKDSSRRKYHGNDAFRKKVKDSLRRKYHGNDAFRKKVKDSLRRKYHGNDAFREKVKDSSRRKYHGSYDFRKLAKDKSRKKYSENKDFRQKVKTSSREKYRLNSLFQTRVKASSVKKYSSNPLFRSKLKSKIKNMYHQSPLLQQRTKSAVRIARLSVTVPKAIRNFQRSIQDTPEYVCTVCIRTLYKTQVKLCKRSTYMKDGKLTDTAARCLTGNYVHRCETKHCVCKVLSRRKEWICKTCDRHLLKGQMPPQAQANNLNLPDVPEVLSRLNGLERQLIALRIPFMKLLSLPRGGQRGVKGPVVNVPTDLNTVTTSLPRTTNDAQLVKVKLKRKLAYKGHYQYEWVNPTHVIEALRYLMDHNKWYSSVSFNDTWLHQTQEDDIVRKGTVESDSESDNETIETDQEHTSKSKETENMVSDFPVESCLQPLDPGQEYLDTGDKIFSIAPSENQSPQSILTEEGIDAMAFPSLLPDGNFGLSALREIKLTPSKYFNARLFSADPRFSTDNQFIFFAQYITELTDIISKMSIALRKGKGSLDSGETVTAAMLSDSAHLKDILKSDSGFRFLQPIRGSPPYWQRTIKDLYGIIRQLGIPTWFITFSAGETRWNEVIRTLLNITSDNRDVSEIEWSEKCKLIRENPLMCSRLFDHRVRCLFNDLLKSSAQPIGEIQDFFYRTEFQARGSPHIHCLFWIRGAPKLDHDEDSTICDFVDKYVTCELPDQESDPELYDIVTAVQVHSRNHSKSCKKHSTTCRFHFPRPPIKQTFIARVKDEEEEQQTELSEKPPETAEELDMRCKKSAKSGKEILRDIWTVINGLDSEVDLNTDSVLKLANVTYEEFQAALTSVTTRTSIYYKRSVADTWVNNYNKDLLRAWNANIDIQFVVDAYLCVAYILAYISKAEDGVGDLILNAKKEAAEGNSDAATSMKKIGQAYIQNREISAQEATYRVCSLHLKECSRDVQFIPTGSKPLKMSLPMSVIKSKRQEDDNIWMASVIEKYYARPSTDAFNDMCLADFCSKYTILPLSKKPKSSAKLPIFELQKHLGFIRQKKAGSESVIRYPRFNKVKQPEEYYLTLLQLYVPHRAQITKPPEFNTFEDLVRCGNVTNIINTNRSRFEIDSEEIESAWQDLQDGKIREDAWSMIGPESEVERLDIELEKGPVLPLDDENEEIIELSGTGQKQRKRTLNPSVEVMKPNMTQKQIHEMMSKMNQTQQDVFYKIRDWSLRYARKENPSPFHLFVTGGAGTGKTHLIKCIYHDAIRILGKVCTNPDAQPVLLTAPTGTAAFNVEGNTIHSAFALSKNLTLPYIPLAENMLNTLRTKFQDLHILVIDEISMVDHKMLSYIHGRLCQIKQSKNYFGNICVIAVGDFHQLPPVKASPLCKIQPTIFVDLWNPVFSVATLTEIMRQKDAVSFAKMLNRVRTCCKPKTRNRRNDVDVNSTDEGDKDKVVEEEEEDGEPLNDEDLGMLKSVSYDKETLPAKSYDFLHIFPTNREVDSHNAAMVERVCQPMSTVLANDFVKNYSTGELVRRDTPFFTNDNEDLLSTMKIGENARIMLTRNVDVEDGLVNGAFGTIRGMDTTTNGNIVAVYVQFDNAKCGKKHIAKSTAKNSLSKKYVRIVPVEENLHKKPHVTRKQFPFKLGWAATIHKVQGMTVKNVVVSLKKIFRAGMAYVAISRATSLAGLHIIDFDPNAIYSSSDVRKAVENMPRFLTPTYSDDEVILEPRVCTISLHNTEGLIPHLNDAKNATILKSADITCLTETWMKRSQTLIKSFLPNHLRHLKSRSESYDHSSAVFKDLANKDRGGVAMFVKKSIQPTSFHCHTKNMECISCTINGQLQMSLSLVYRPPTYNIRHFCESLNLLLTKVESLDIPTIVLGDFNDDINKPSDIKSMFANFGYTQLVTEPTTESGTTLDCVYVKNCVAMPKIKVVPLYYSFHEAVVIQLSY